MKIIYRVKFVEGDWSYTKYFDDLDLVKHSLSLTFGMNVDLIPFGAGTKTLAAPNGNPIYITAIAVDCVPVSLYK